MFFGFQQRVLAQFPQTFDTISCPIFLQLETEGKKKNEKIIPAVN
jgi:hypothetical protein